jgi:hypothetical protein
MVQPLIYEIDTDGTIHSDALHWEGFPRILWETLSEVGYTTPPLYEVVSFWDQGVPYARTTATVLPHPKHPEWADLSLMFFAHRGVESVESAAIVTPAFLAPNKSPNKSCVFSKLSSRAQSPPSNPSHRPSLSPRRTCRESRRHRPHPGQHPRVPSQRRGRPPCRESRTRRGPRRPVRLAITAVPKITPMPGNRKIPQNPFL